MLNIVSIWSWKITQCLERSHNVNVVDEDIFSTKAICVFLKTVCILSCSNCDLLKLKLSYKHMFPWLPTLKARSLSKSTNLAPPRIGTKQNETKRRRSIVNRLISEISWFWIVECWRVCQRTCTISIEQFITHTYHDLRTHGQFSDILRMRHLRSIIVCRRCTSYTYFAVSLCAELP